MFRNQHGQFRQITVDGCGAVRRSCCCRCQPTDSGARPAAVRHTGRSVCPAESSRPANGDRRDDERRCAGDSVRRSPAGERVRVAVAIGRHRFGRDFRVYRPLWALAVLLDVPVGVVSDSLHVADLRLCVSGAFLIEGGTDAIARAAVTIRNPRARARINGNRKLVSNYDLERMQIAHIHWHTEHGGVSIHISKTAAASRLVRIIS